VAGTLELEPSPQSRSGLSRPAQGLSDDWASGAAICPVFAQRFAGDERILQEATWCRLLLLVWL